MLHAVQKLAQHSAAAENWTALHLLLAPWLQLLHFSEGLISIDGCRSAAKLALHDYQGALADAQASVAVNDKCVTGCGAPMAAWSDAQCRALC